MGAMSLVWNAAEWKSMFEFIQDPPLTMEQPQMAVCDPDTQEGIPDGRARLVEWTRVLP